MKIQTECPYCKSKDLSDGKSDYIYEEGGVGKLIQFCSDCHEEWFIDVDEIKELIYLPTETDKAIINGLCNEIIDILTPLSVPQKAFALQSLISSFEDVANIKLTAIKFEEEKIK